MSLLATSAYCLCVKCNPYVAAIKLSHMGIVSTSPTFLRLTGDPVYTWLSVFDLIMPGRAALGRSNGLAWL
jgi:hypothetical protein